MSTWICTHTIHFNNININKIKCVQRQSISDLEHLIRVINSIESYRVHIRNIRWIPLDEYNICVIKEFICLPLARHFTWNCCASRIIYRVMYVRTYIHFEWIEADVDRVTHSRRIQIRRFKDHVWSRVCLEMNTARRECDVRKIGEGYGTRK